MSMLVYGCSDKSKLTIDVSNIDTNITIKRFEKAFYEAKPSDLSKIKKEFRFLFPHDIDSIWVKKMQDTDEQELFRETQRVYPNLKVLKVELEDIFKHVKYYYPKFSEPKVITIISNVDFEHRVVYVDSLLFISLDVFLGKENNIYQDYPDYIKQNFTKKQLTVSVAKELAKPIVFKTNNRTFLSRMIQEGKKMYALDAFLPKYSDADKISYTNSQIKWVKENEDMIWSYFIEKELLYNTNVKLSMRFIDEAPFSKFYLDIDNESPGRVGVWLGWQIVRSYMEHNKNASLADLMNTKNEEIFKKSKYKPKK